MTALAVVLVLLPVVVALYAYFGYPLVLAALSLVRRLPGPATRDPAEWPMLSLVLPAYNEAGSIRRTLDRLLELDYPAERLQILVVSDASTDGTDQIVAEYEGRVELLRQPERRGKTAAENLAARHVRGDIVLSTDATIQIPSDAIRPLVRAFEDPEVGLASGRDISISSGEIEATTAEAGYVGYEMWVRAKETRVGSIVGASGCFYAIRRPLYEALFPEALSRDFASALISREHGYRSVSVDSAICLVPRAPELGIELKRKIRTMARGLDTLWYKRALLNPFRFGLFSFMLASHKLARWCVYPLVPLALAGLVLLALQGWVGRGLLGLTLVGIVLGVIAVRAGSERRLPGALSACGFALITTVAGLAAWVERIRGSTNPIWEPTRRAAGAREAESDG